MLRANVLVLIAILVLAVSMSLAAETIKSPSIVAQRMSQMPMAFTKNNGQWDGRVLFRANAGGATMWFTPNGAYYQFTRRVGLNSGLAAWTDRVRTLGREQERDSIETLMIKANFVGCNPNARLAGENLLEYKCNYFLDHDQSKWRTDVPNYTSLIYREVYPGIDLKYYGDGRQMEYDFIVSPAADYSQIKIQYEGANSMAVNGNGDLVIETSWGTVTEKVPVVYQVDGAKRTAIAGAYRVFDSQSFGFALGTEYNRLLPVVIDPVLSYSTYLGGNSDDYGRGIAVDEAGSAYVTGETYSANFPTVTPFDGSWNGEWDAFVTKLSPTGNSLVYSTFLGGSNNDYGYAIAVDGAGSSYVTGRTWSGNFPTVNPLDGSLNPSGSWDAFVTKLSPAGNSLVYSSYLGGYYNDDGYGIAVDGTGSAYVTGETSSYDFPTVTPFDTTFNGNSDVFVTKVSPLGNSLVYSTFLGGTFSDVGSGIAVDGAGSAYVTGYTQSPNFPTVSPFEGTLNGNLDVFVTKLSPGGNILDYSTYLGGSGGDFGTGIAVDGAGSAYVAGFAGSADFPTQNPYQPYQGSGDAFVTKLSPGGTSLAYSTFLGGSDGEEGNGIAVDSGGSAYVTGSTYSSDFPTITPFDSTFNGGTLDAFVTKLGPTGNSMSYSTYLGGSDFEICLGIAIDHSGNAYVTGWTQSTDFPTLNPYQSTYQGGAKDAFVTKLNEFPAYVCGDADGSTGVDISDAVYLIAYIFAGGPAPDPLASGDADCSGGVDISDAVYLIAYIFAGGPTPCATCK